MPTSEPAAPSAMTISPMAAAHMRLLIAFSRSWKTSLDFSRAPQRSAHTASCAWGIDLEPAYLDEAARRSAMNVCRSRTTLE